MINLLPPEVKDSFRYARRNYHLYRWVKALGFGILGALIITAFGYLYLQQTAKSYEKQVATSQANLKAQNFDKIQREVKDMSNNLQLASQVLSKQVLFSELLKQLSTILPRDTVLTNLTISQAQNGLDITAQSKTYEAGTQLQVNLSDAKNKLFSKADIIGISCPESPSNPAYPCSVSIRAEFAPNNPFLVSGSTGVKR
jgi:Tfp pilus assembly protein PilN